MKLYAGTIVLGMGYYIYKFIEISDTEFNDIDIDDDDSKKE